VEQRFQRSPLETTHTCRRFCQAERPVVESREERKRVEISEGRKRVKKKRRLRRGHRKLRRETVPLNLASRKMGKGISEGGKKCRK